MEDETDVEYEVHNEEPKTEKKHNNEFSKILKGYIDKGVVVAQKGFKSAGSALSEFGDKSVIHIEIGQLNSKLDKIYRDIGAYVSDKLLSDAESIQKTDESIAEKLNEISKLKEAIQQKEELLKKYDKN